MLSCLDKMYSQKYVKKSKSWAISFQNALFSNAMNVIKSNADGASEKGCRLVITGDIVENSVGLSKIFDIYINIFKCLSYYYKGEELKELTEKTFEEIVRLNFSNYGDFINTPKKFVEKNFKTDSDLMNNQQKHSHDIDNNNKIEDSYNKDEDEDKDEYKSDDVTPISDKKSSDFSNDNSVMNEEPFNELEKKEFKVKKDDTYDEDVEVENNSEFNDEDYEDFELVDF